MPLGVDGPRHAPGPTGTVHYATDNYATDNSATADSATAHSATAHSATAHSATAHSAHGRPGTWWSCTALPLPLLTRPSALAAAPPHSSATPTPGVHAHVCPTAEDRTRAAAAGIKDRRLGCYRAGSVPTEAS